MAKSRPPRAPKLPPTESIPPLDPTRGAPLSFDVVLEFLALYWADREAGRAPDLGRYLRAFPGHEELVAHEFLRQERGESGTSSVSLSVSAASPEEAERAAAELATSGERYRVVGPAVVDGPLLRFEARDEAFGRDVELLLASDANDSAFAEWLTGVAARLAHPHIVSLHDVVMNDGALDNLAALRGADGMPLGAVGVFDPLVGVPVEEAWERDGAGPMRRWITLQQISEAISYAHRLGIAHGALADPDAIRVGRFGALSIGRWYRASLTTGRPELGEDLVALADLLDASRARLELGPNDADADHRIVELVERCRSGDFDLPSLTDGIQRAIDGALDRDRRRRGRDEALAEVEALDQRRARQTSELDRLRTKLEAQRPEPWQPVADKRNSWELERKVRHAEDEVARLENEAILALESAREWSPRDLAVRQQLAERYEAVRSRGLETEDSVLTTFAEERLLTLDLPEVDAELRAPGRLSVTLDPPAERVSLRRLAEKDRRLVPQGKARVSPGSPHRWEGLDAGSWQLDLRASEVRWSVPVLVERNRTTRCRWRLRTASETGPGFRWVPSGAVTMGGDAEARDPRPRAVVAVSEFAISEVPITVAEYADFIRALQAEATTDRDRRALEARLPQLGDLGPSLALDRGAVRILDRRSRWPVSGIRWQDARAYAAWRSERDGRRYRLPSDTEWEKAARGPDRRRYPWGDRFDPTFCKHAGSTAGDPRPEPVGRYRSDISPYGVRDLAGGVMDWCRSWFSQPDRQRLIRGGSWRSGPLACRAASRAGAPPDERYPFVGFRLVHRFER